MKPPYHPEHVERILFVGQTHVRATCSCGRMALTKHRLAERGTTQALIAELNAHRATYV